MGFPFLRNQLKRRHLMSKAKKAVKVVLTPIVIYFTKTFTGYDAVTGDSFSKTLKEPWPMLVDYATGNCWYAVGGKSKGKILNDTPEQVEEWAVGSFFGELY
tara:strand:+ start:227 stop:532 length:306 start_codon:yes stop_codon:yes gene_type:complete